MTEKIKKVLLIEDDQAIIDIYEIMIKKANFDVESISSGQQAIEIIKNIITGEQIKPDIFLLDLILPDINGMEVFREIKKNKETKDIKVFILTNQQESQLQWLDDIRPDKFLIKANTTITQLLELIKQELK